MAEKQAYTSVPTAPQSLQEGNAPPPYTEAASSGMPPQLGQFQPPQPQANYNAPYPQQQQQAYPPQPQQPAMMYPSQHIQNQPMYPGGYGAGEPGQAAMQPAPPGYNKGVVGGQAVPPPPPGQQPIQQTIIMQSTFGRNPTPCVCPQCHQSVVTSTVAEVGLFIWMISLLILLVGGWVFCLCLIPFCIDDIKDVRHQCPNCKHTIYVCKRA